MTVDLSKIPDYRRRELALGAIDLTKAIFSRPGEEEKYQKWLSERQAAGTEKE